MYVKLKEKREQKRHIDEIAVNKNSGLSLQSISYSSKNNKEETKKKITYKLHFWGFFFHRKISKILQKSQKMFKSSLPRHFGTIPPSLV